jgi:retinol dehydrogenase-12
MLILWQNQLWAAFGKRAGEGKGAGEVKSGEYYTPVGISGQWGGWAGDAELARRLWEWSERETENYKL